MIDQAMVYAELALDLLKVRFTRNRPVSVPEFLTMAYRRCLKRSPDEDGLSYYSRELDAGRLSRLGVVRALVASNEYRQSAGLPGRPLHAIHQVRMAMVKQLLPPAELIVDIGGAAIGDDRGALLMMGYPHKPRRVIIVDLPPQDRMFGRRHNETAQGITTAEGIRIEYHYGSLSDLSFLPDSQVDLVWSGESIEHVTEAEAEVACRHAFRILKPGGCFCLDTPNAALTRLQSPHALTHPEHKKEYFVAELRALLEKCGFSIMEAKALLPMPESLRRQVFDVREQVANIRFGDTPEEGYLFFLKARKPVVLVG